MRKKFLVLILSLPLFVFLFLLSRTTLAAPLNANDINQKTWTNVSLIEMADSAICMITGYDVTAEDGSGCVYYGENGRLQKSDKPNGGALRTISSLVASLYSNPPASGIQYFADLGKEFGITHPVYAQGGIGFTALSPLLKIWKASRDLAYVFFIVAFVVAGLAIMFRMKIDPRTAVTIESALPKIVITLILVTFSYAIAGLLIDLSYVVIGLGVFILAPADPSLILADEQAKYMGLGLVDGLSILISSGFSGIVGLTMAIGSVLAGIVGIVLTVVATPIALMLGGILTIPLLVLGVMAITALFKLFFALLKSYISIIFYIIFAPLIIMVGALPGVQAGFMSWFMNLLANILVFPATALFILLSYLLTHTALPTWSPPVLQVSGGSLLSSLIGFGMLLMAPTVPQMVLDAFGFKPSRYGSAIGESLDSSKRLATGSIQGGAKAAAVGATGGVAKAAQILARI